MLDNSQTHCSYILLQSLRSCYLNTRRNTIGSRRLRTIVHTHTLSRVFNVYFVLLLILLLLINRSVFSRPFANSASTCWWSETVSVCSCVRVSTCLFDASFVHIHLKKLFNDNNLYFTYLIYILLLITFPLPSKLPLFNIHPISNGGGEWEMV